MNDDDKYQSGDVIQVCLEHPVFPGMFLVVEHQKGDRLTGYYHLPGNMITIAHATVKVTDTRPLDASAPFELVKPEDVPYMDAEYFDNE